MTIISSPSGLPSAHGDVIYTVSDAHAADPVTYPNYKYIADVYVNGVMVERVKKFPLPSNNVGVFNIGTIIRSYVLATFSPTASLQSQELGRGEFYIDVQVKFGEEYSYTSYYDLEESDEIKLYNNYNKLFPGAAWAENALITNAPFLDATLQQEYLFLTYFPNSTSSVTIDITPDNGSTYSTSISPSTAYFAQLLNVSPTTINALSANKINAATSYYDVTVDGETLRVYLKCEPRYDTYEIHFLNQYGGYDSKLFNKVSRKMVEVNKSSFEKLAYTVDDSGQVAYYDANSVYNETGYTYASQFNEKWMLNSDFLNDAQYRWLYDLIVSPQVYIYLDGYFIPVKITDNNYEVRKRVNDDLTNLVINIEFGRTFNAQYR